VAESKCKYCPKYVLWAWIVDEDGKKHRIPLEPCDHGLFVITAGDIAVEVDYERAEQYATNGARRYTDHKKVCTRMPATWEQRAPSRNGVAA
jgi:hypothetical protein